MSVKEKIRSILRDIKESLKEYAENSAYRTGVLPPYRLV